MKITKKGIDANEQERLRIEANKGCNICPCCGTPSHYNKFLSKKSVIIKGNIFTKRIKKVYKIDRYHCENCKAEWESEPYEVLSERKEY